MAGGGPTLTTRRGVLALGALALGWLGLREYTARPTPPIEIAPTESSIAHFRRLMVRSQQTVNAGRVWTQADHQALWVDLHDGLRALRREQSGPPLRPRGVREL